MAMKQEMRKEIDQYLMDTLMERPYSFSVGDIHYSLYPVTLGKMYVLQNHISQLVIDQKMMKVDISLEALRLAKEKREECLHVIYIHTCKGKDEVFDVQMMTERIGLFDREMTDEDIAALMIIVLSSDKTEMFIKHLGIDKELKDMRKVMEVKNRNDRNNFTFGGLSVYGSFIHPLMELGMSWNEILWERSYTNLRMLMADKVSSLYVTDDERKKIHISRDRNRINGDNCDDLMKAISSQDWE